MPRLLLAALLASLVALGTGCLLTPSCDCGRSYDPDPAGGASLGLGVGHASGAHCYCRCDGAGPETRFPPSRDCTWFEVACTTADGDEGTFDCSGGVR